MRKLQKASEKKNFEDAGTQLEKRFFSPFTKGPNLTFGVLLKSTALTPKRLLKLTALPPKRLES